MGQLHSIVPTLLAAILPASPQKMPEANLHIEPSALHVWAAEEVIFVVTLANSGSAPIETDIVWRLAARSAVIRQGRETVKAPPSGSGKVRLRVAMPEAERKVDMTLAALATLEDGRPLEARAQIRVYPNRGEFPQWQFIKGKKVALYDPHQLCSAAIEQSLIPAGASLVTLSDAPEQEWPKADLLILGPQSISDRGKWGDFQKLISKAPAKCPVLVFQQSPTAISVDEQARLRFVGSSDSSLPYPGFHFDASDLEAEDLRDWRGGSGMIPRLLLQPLYGNYRWLIAASGPVCAAVCLEMPSYNGNPVIYCQAPVIEKWSVEPAAPLLFNRLLRWALVPIRPFTRHNITFCGPADSPMLHIAMSILPPNRRPPIVENLTDLFGGVILVDAGIFRRPTAEQQVLFPLHEHLRQGGKAVIVQNSQVPAADALVAADWLQPETAHPVDPRLLRGVRHLADDQTSVRMLSVGQGEVYFLGSTERDGAELPHALGVLLTNLGVWLDD